MLHILHGRAHNYERHTENSSIFISEKSAIAQVDTGYLPVARFECDLMLYKTHLASLCLCRCL